MATVNAKPIKCPHALWTSSLSLQFVGFLCVPCLCQVNAFDSISYRKWENKGSTSGSRCSGGEPSTLCGAGTDDELALFISTTPPPLSPSHVTSRELLPGEIFVAGLPMSVESHLFMHVADPLQHRSRKTVVQMPPHQHCQLIQIPIDFLQPTTVVISLSTKLNK